MAWWCHQMEILSALLALCAGNSPVTGEFLAQRPVTRSFDVFFDLRLNRRLSKQSWGWWFETPARSLWRHRNAKWFHAMTSTWLMVVLIGIVCIAIECTVNDAERSFLMNYALLKLRNAIWPKLLATICQCHWRASGNTARFSCLFV